MASVCICVWRSRCSMFMLHVWWCSWFQYKQFQTVTPVSLSSLFYIFSCLYMYFIWGRGWYHYLTLLDIYWMVKPYIISFGKNYKAKLSLSKSIWKWQTDICNSMLLWYIIFRLSLNLRSLATSNNIYTSKSDKFNDGK